MVSKKKGTQALLRLHDLQTDARERKRGAYHNVGNDFLSILVRTLREIPL